MKIERQYIVYLTTEELRWLLKNPNSGMERKASDGIYIDVNHRKPVKKKINEE